MSIDPSNYTQTFLQVHKNVLPEKIFFETRPLFSYTDTPPYLDNSGYNIMSIPMVGFLGGAPSIDDIKYE
jgi:hypothetical protein